jgi:E-phenylitaconyl-CoA hydratase
MTAIDVAPGLLFDIEEGVAWLTLDRAEAANAVTPEMHRGLKDVWARVRDDEDISVAIVTGAGDRHFCTGADLRSAAASGRLASGDGPLPLEVFYSPRQNNVWKPVIAAVNGLVVGAGLHFVVDADIVVAAAHAEFMDTHVTVGQVGGPENVGLARRLPLGTALRMTLMGRSYRLPADRAYALGLVDEVVPAGELRDTCLQMARAMQGNSPRAMSLSKQAIWQSLETGYAAGLEHAWALVRLHRLHADAVEGPRAFAERRPPRWQR